MAGVFIQIPTEPRLRTYQNEEEYFATLFENIYRSEVSSELLFGYDATELPENLKKSIGFLKDPEYGVPNRRLVHKLVYQQKDLCSDIRDLVDISVEFNPIREFMIHMSKYPLQ